MGKNILAYGLLGKAKVQATELRNLSGLPLALSEDPNCIGFPEDKTEVVEQKLKPFGIEIVNITN